LARILIVAGGGRGLRLAEGLCADGHAVRVTTRQERGRAGIEATGAECWIGDPDRLATLRPALENVTIACWLLSAAMGTEEQIRALHGSRLESFLHQIIDTSIRGLVYEAGEDRHSATGSAAAVVKVRSVSELNSIPLRVIESDPRDEPTWQSQTRAAIDSLLS